MEQRAIVHIAGEMRCRKTAQNKPVFGRIRHRGPATEATIADRPLYASSARTERRSQRSHPTSRLSEEKEAVVVFRENPGTLVQNSKSHRCDVCTRALYNEDDHGKRSVARNVCLRNFLRR
jgi:hypothetical protein